MVNEAVWEVNTGLATNFTVADGTGIEKGTICTLTDPLTASQTTASGAAIAGIAVEEKIASDGRTQLGMLREGRFKVTASGSITAGDGLILAANGVNQVLTAGRNPQIPQVGIALETATDQETFFMELRPTGGTA